MALEVGSRLGHYDVTALIGEGGMGQVYSATDTKLNRQVALKILPEAFATDPDRLARFQREAQVLASLNHPGIAAIYGLEDSENQKALVLELVEGPTLADRIKRGPIPLDEALPIAKQIAEALEAAHEAGVIHRDLKPANIKVRDDGTVKVLDFGLAKALDPTPEGDPSQSPTLTAAATQMGVIMGTAAYMSPEQARGKPVDKRADIWAFGCVLYEMLTGQMAFQGEDVSLTLASVMKSDLNLKTLPPEVPAAIRTVLGRCLEKDPNRRLRDVGDWTLLLEHGGGVEEPTAPAVTGRTRWLWPAAATGLALALGAAIALWAPWRAEPEAFHTRLRTGLPSGIDLSTMSSFAVSPDGRSVVMAALGAAGQGLWLWPLDSLDATPLPGTDGATGAFWSPDGRSVGFSVGGALRRIDVAGGPPQDILSQGMSAGVGQRATWNSDGVILFRNTGGLFRVPAGGGESTPVVVTGPTSNHLDLPVFLPDGVHFLYLDHSAREEDRHGVYIGSLDAAPDEQPSTPLLAATDGPLLVHNAGWEHAQVVFWREGTLLAQPFDVDTLELTGDAVPVAAGVSGGFGNGWFSASANGDVLVYQPGAAYGPTGLVWVDRQGQEERIDVPPRAYGHPRVSPDGTRVAVDITEGENSDIWILDLERRTSTQLTFDDGGDDYPLWAPDGARIVFRSSRDGGGLFWKATDGTGQVERLVEFTGRPVRAEGWTADGGVLFWRAPGQIGVFGMVGERTVEMLLDGGRREQAPTLSPDGKWLAYGSNETGTNLIYVRPYPNVDEGQWRASLELGRDPVWSSDGRELFYLSQTNLMAVRIETEPAFSAGTPEPLFGSSGYTFVQATGGRQFDLAPDGNRFIFRQAVATGLPSDNEPFEGLIVVQNWFRELTEGVATK